MSAVGSFRPGHPEVHAPGIALVIKHRCFHLGILVAPIPPGWPSGTCIASVSKPHRLLVVFCLLALSGNPVAHAPGIAIVSNHPCFHLLFGVSKQPWLLDVCCRLLSPGASRGTCAGHCLSHQASVFPSWHPCCSHSTRVPQRYLHCFCMQTSSFTCCLLSACFVRESSGPRAGHCHSKQPSVFP